MLIYFLMRRSLIYLQAATNPMQAYALYITFVIKAHRVYQMYLERKFMQSAVNPIQTQSKIRMLAILKAKFSLLITQWRRPYWILS